MRVGIIGFGGMGRVVCRVLLEQGHDANIEIAGVIVSAEDYKEAEKYNTMNIPLLDSFEDLMRQKPDVIAECAGHDAVRQYGHEVLSAGISLLVISIGALAEESLYEQLRETAKLNDASVYLPAGAVGGIDALTAARLAGLQKVTYRGRKPALAWRGTPAEETLDLTGLYKAECFYSGSARDAALAFPRNSNVAATVALAGLGFDETRVELLADPDISENMHELEVEAISGNFQVSLSGIPLDDSPKTSALAAYSVAKCLLDMNTAVII
ncbi:MAG: aspartate dehydrogenase [Gammaproteobacteria bacterium]|nr:aspartate dehydrogenase [Gammaproteobacteria bacterium]